MKHSRFFFLFPSSVVDSYPTKKLLFRPVLLASLFLVFLGFHSALSCLAASSLIPQEELPCVNAVFKFLLKLDSRNP